MANPPTNITFSDSPETYNEFFLRNGLFNDEYKYCSFVLRGASGCTTTLFRTTQNGQNIIYIPSPNGLIDLREQGKDNIIVGLTIINRKTFEEVDSLIEQDSDGYEGAVPGWEKTYGSTGGRKASVKKEICGVMRCIYKISGSRKEHIKYKGRLITVADYKKLMKNKA
jgi:hypothetical protein